jgi:hypothetical protein
MFCLFPIWEREVKGGSLVYGAFGPDAASVTMNNALNRRQPDAGALEFAGGMEALERSE